MPGSRGAPRRGRDAAGAERDPSGAACHLVAPGPSPPCPGRENPPNTQHRPSGTPRTQHRPSRTPRKQHRPSGADPSSHGFLPVALSPSPAGTFSPPYASAKCFSSFPCTKRNTLWQEQGSPFPSILSCCRLPPASHFVVSLLPHCCWSPWRAAGGTQPRFFSSFSYVFNTPRSFRDAHTSLFLHPDVCKVKGEGKA